MNKLVTPFFAGLHRVADPQRSNEQIGNNIHSGDDSVIMRLAVDDTGNFLTLTWLNGARQWKGYLRVPKS